MLHGDVFRPPQYMPELYCVFMGTGFHLALTSIVVIVFSLLGVVSPARRGSLLNAALVVYALGSSSSDRLIHLEKGRLGPDRRHVADHDGDVGVSSGRAKHREVASCCSSEAL